MYNTFHRAMHFSLPSLLIGLSVISLVKLDISFGYVSAAVTEEEGIAIISRKTASRAVLHDIVGGGFHRRKKGKIFGNSVYNGSYGHYHQKMKLFAVATDTMNENFLMFNSSAQKSGLIIHLLGVGDFEMKEVPLNENEKLDKKTTNLPFHSRANFGRKILHFHEALLKIEDVNTFVVLVDAYDTIFLSTNPRELIVAYERARHYAYRLRVRYGEYSQELISSSSNLHGRYRQFPTIIASGEKNCWPDKTLSPHYPSYSSGHTMRYLNSGVVAGFVKDFLLLFSSLPYKGNESSDQRYWVGALLASQNKASLPIIDLDYQNHLVASISKSSWDLLVITEPRGDISKRGIGIRNLMGTPKILHLPNNKDKLKYLFENLVSSTTGTSARNNEIMK